MVLDGFGQDGAPFIIDLTHLADMVGQMALRNESR
jgi:hypothetical protein